MLVLSLFPRQYPSVNLVEFTYKTMQLVENVQLDDILARFPWYRNCLIHEFSGRVVGDTAG